MNDPRETGNWLEGPLLDWFSIEHDVILRRNQYRVAKAGPGRGVLAAHLDATIPGTSEGVEAKYVGQSMAGDWGEPGTDEVPDYVLVQVQHAMYCANLQRMWVPIAMAGYSLERKEYVVPRNDKAIGIIVEREMAFFHDHILARVPPTPGPPPLEVMMALRREPGSLKLLDDGTNAYVREYEILTRLKRKVEEDVDFSKQALLNLLGNAEGGRLPDGTLITYLQQNSPARCDLKRLRADLPDVYDQYVTQGTHRVLRIKRPKEAIADASDTTAALCFDPNPNPTEAASLTFGGNADGNSPSPGQGDADSPAGD